MLQGLMAILTSPSIKILISFFVHNQPDTSLDSDPPILSVETQLNPVVGVQEMAVVRGKGLTAREGYAGV